MTNKLWINKEQNDLFLEAFKNQDYVLIKNCIDKNWDMPLVYINKQVTTGLSIAISQSSLTSVKLIMEDMKYFDDWHIGEQIQELFRAYYSNKKNLQEHHEILNYLLQPAITNKLTENTRTNIIDRCCYDINDLNILKENNFNFVDPYIKKNKLAELASSSVWDKEFEFLLNNYDQKSKRRFFYALSTQPINIHQDKFNILGAYFQNNEKDYNLFYKFCDFYANRNNSSKIVKQTAIERKQLFGSIKTYFKLQDSLSNDKIVKKSAKI